MSTFKDKVALITGASQGCGKVCAIAFAREGAKVVLIDIQEEKGNETLEAIKKEGGEGTFLKLDVRNESDVEEMVRKTVEAYGRLDCAFNNAGTEENTLIVNETEENYLWQMDTNVKGVFFCLKYEIRQMLKNGGGAIVNHASVTSNITGVPTESIYAASKAAVIGMTQSAALEVASQGISINAIASCGIDIPGNMFRRYMESQKVDPNKMREFFPIKRFGKGEELAHAVLFLCSDLARFIVGHTLVIDGGFTVP